MKALHAVPLVVAAMAAILPGSALRVTRAAASQEGPSYTSDALGISFRYPDGWTSWIEGEPGSVYPRTCIGCAHFEPPNADPPRGVVVFDWPAYRGWQTTCVPSIDAGDFSRTVNVIVGGQDAFQTEFDRIPPAGAPTTPLYREIWTCTPGGMGLIVIAAFWPKDDPAAEAEVRSGYRLILQSLRFVSPAEVVAPGPSLPSTGVGSIESPGRGIGALLALMAAFGLACAAWSVRYRA